MYNVIRLVFIFTIIFQLPHLVICQDDENDFNIIVINTGDKPECISCGTLYDPKIDNFLRVTIGTDEEMDRFLSAVAVICEKRKE